MFVIIVLYAYFIDISQGSVETHLRCSGTYNNRIIANCQLLTDFRNSFTGTLCEQRYEQK